MIRDVRKQAFKPSTIISSFSKTGIVPFNPLKVLNRIAARRRSPSPPRTPEHQSGVLSSPFGTPLTYRKVDSVAHNLKKSAEKLIEVHEELSEELELIVEGIDRFTRGALVQAAELIQTRDDLSRTRLADQVRRARRAGKNRQLQSGGVLTMAQGRHIVAEKGLGEVAAAIAAKKRAADAIEKATKEVFKAAAKKARSWYMTNKLPAAYVVTSERSGRRLKRF